MKRLLFMLALASCAVVAVAQRDTRVVYQESSTRNLEPDHYMMTAPLIADVVVSQQKISYTEKEAYKILPVTAANAEQIKSMMPDLKKIALSRAAKTYDADLLVGTIIDVITNDQGFLEITVSGYPAKYTNFRNATRQDIENVQEARIATYGQDNTEILRRQKSTDVQVKEK
ncbi:MAG: hypothetical protein IKY75_00350 [Bacteroidaceae bacterium]|nr:hypothetical protein [Bacteroidaceae bacterium]